MDDFYDLRNPLISDSEIIKFVLAGDREQYAELVRRHQAHVLSLCRGLLLNPTLAEDAAQDIFVKVFKILEQFKNRSLFSTWLFRIATNHCLDVKRNLRRLPTESLENLSPLNKISVQNTSPGIEKRFEMRDFAAYLLKDLSEAEHATLVLKEGEGLSYEEISGVLDISIDAVKSRLKRAREKIEEKARHFLRVQNV